MFGVLYPRIRKLALVCDDMKSCIFNGSKLKLPGSVQSTLSLAETAVKRILNDGGSKQVTLRVADIKLRMIKYTVAFWFKVYLSGTACCVMAVLFSAYLWDLKLLCLLLIVGFLSSLVFAIFCEDNYVLYGRLDSYRVSLSKKGKVVFYIRHKFGCSDIRFRFDGLIYLSQVLDICNAKLADIEGKKEIEQRRRHIKKEHYQDQLDGTSEVLEIYKAL